MNTKDGVRARSLSLLAVALLAGCAATGSREVSRQAAACPRGAAMAIEFPQKIGIGVWEVGPPGRSLARVGALGVAWYYSWSPDPLTGRFAHGGPEFVPMIWGARPKADFQAGLAAVRKSGATVLLGFNEPDRSDQSSLSVAEALQHWPALAASANRVGSPAPSQVNALGEERWLPRFMVAVGAVGPQPDFVAVHYYAGEPDVERLRRFLERVHAAYGRPIWLTEWGLVDGETWKDGRARFSMQEAACFFRAGAAMMDDLPFVERHAWFAAFDGGDGWHLNIHAVSDDGRLTAVGRAIRDATH